MLTKGCVQDIHHTLGFHALTVCTLKVSFLAFTITEKYKGSISRTRVGIPYTLNSFLCNNYDLIVNEWYVFACSVRIM